MTPDIQEKTVWLITYMQNVADDPNVPEGHLRDNVRNAARIINQLMEWNLAQHEFIKPLKFAFWSAAACAVVASAAALYFKNHCT